MLWYTRQSHTSCRRRGWLGGIPYRCPAKLTPVSRIAGRARAGGTARTASDGLRCPQRSTTGAAQTPWRQRSTDAVLTQSCFGRRRYDPSFRSTRSCHPSCRSPTFCRPTRLRKGLEDGRTSERYDAYPHALLRKDRGHYAICITPTDLCDLFLCRLNCLTLTFYFGCHNT